MRLFAFLVLAMMFAGASAHDITCTLPDGMEGKLEYRDVVTQINGENGQANANQVRFGVDGGGFLSTDEAERSAAVDAAADAERQGIPFVFCAPPSGQLVIHSSGVLRPPSSSGGW